VIDLRAAVDAYVEKDNRQNLTPKGSIWVTDLARARQCLRQVVIGITHTAVLPDFHEDTKRIFSSGKLAEPTMRAVLQEQGIVVRDQQERLSDNAPTLPVSGKIDGRLSDGTILELKTIGGNAFRGVASYLDGGGDLRHYPGYYSTYWWQVQAYLWLTDTALNLPACLVLVNRDALDVRQVEVEPNILAQNYLLDTSVRIRHYALQVREALIQATDRLRAAHGKQADEFAYWEADVLNALPMFLEEEPPCAGCRCREVCNPLQRYRADTYELSDAAMLDAVKRELERKAAGKQPDPWEDARRHLNAFREANQEGSRPVCLVRLREGYAVKGKRRTDGVWIWTPLPPVADAEGGE
jgi:hypothetical protein